MEPDVPPVNSDSPTDEMKLKRANRLAGTPESIGDVAATPRDLRPTGRLTLYPHRHLPMTRGFTRRRSTPLPPIALLRRPLSSTPATPLLARRAGLWNAPISRSLTRPALAAETSPPQQTR